MNQPRRLTNHRGNVLNPVWTHVGIGVAYAPQGQLIVTQIYLTTLVSPSVSWPSQTQATTTLLDDPDVITTEAIVITDPDSDRYHTFGYISWWQQEVVRDATVLVVGAGALGNEVIKNLALMGIGNILIADFDTIEDSNLSRSVLFRSSDRGRRKVDAAAEAVKALNPDVKVKAWHGDINYEMGLGVFRHVDAIVGCLDNREARLSINRYSWAVNRPWVDGAIQELMGIVRVFWPGQGACYECTLTDLDYQIINLRYSCPLLARENILQGKVPTTPTSASIVAAFQTQEALKLIHDMEVQPGKALMINGLTNDIYTDRIPGQGDVHEPRHAWTPSWSCRRPRPPAPR